MSLSLPFHPWLGDPRFFFRLLCSIRARRSLSEVAVRSRAVGMGTTPDAGVASEFGSSGRGRFGATWLVAMILGYLEK
jgi:hypothetical protein